MKVVSGQLSVVSCRAFLILCALGVLCGGSFSQGLPVAAPQTVGMNAAKLAQIDALVEADIAAKKLPGAVVLVGHKGKIVFRKAYGNRSLVPTVEKMTVDTIFDVASLTKPFATATSIMILVEQGKLRLNDTIGKFIPDIDDENAKKVTIQQLLTHTSGYAPDFDLREKWTGRDGMLAALKKEKLKTAPGTKFVYSDIGFIVLGEIIERVSNLSLFFASQKLSGQAFESASYFNAFHDFDSTTNPLRKLFAPTEDVRGQNSYLGSKFEGSVTDGDAILWGQVHDPTAFRMGGVAGHAGLFSNADDLARYCQMLLNGGIAPEASDTLIALSKKLGVPVKPPVRVLSAQTVAKMTAPIVVSEDGATRGLGWDINTSFSSNRGELFPLGSFGHTGFTGTSVWIDRVSQTFVVFLSNRVHPDGKGDVTPLRAKVATVVASAVEDTPIEMYRLAESTYNSAVAAQIPKFKEQVESAKRAAATDSAPATVYSSTGGHAMPPSNINLSQLTNLKLIRPEVLNGIDVLEKSGFKELEGKRIGLVTNHTGRNLAGKQTIDILNEAKNIKLVALFAPEHGIRGELDTEKIDDSKDEKTGLPVYSMYKEGLRRPRQEQLAGLDAIVYDIQDVGTRFYTYTATLKNVLEEAAKAGKPVFILDRPNPLGGVLVEGAPADEDKLNFIAAHTIPVRYGMTIGELGMMMNTELKIGADVRVIKMDGWSRGAWFDETGQTWINPSPNMRSLTQATLYPGIGLLEYSNLSVGRGTDTPFEVIGAPWMDGQKLAKFLNERGVKGVRFVPIRFKPNASVFKDEQVSGVNIIITDRDGFNSVRTGVEIAIALRKLYPTEWNVEKYAGLLLNKEIFERVKRGETPDEIERAAKVGVDDFLKRRTPFLLYK